MAEVGHASRARMGVDIETYRATICGLVLEIEGQNAVIKKR
jgi:hypothetical protein